MIQENIRQFRWLLFFYSVPSKPVSNRMKVWRKLTKAGAVQIKGAAYILPDTEENFELCQWLISEVASMGGDGAFVQVEQIETMKEKEIVELFNHQREKSYSSIEKGIEEIERRIVSVKKGTTVVNNKRLLAQLNKHLKEFEEIKRIDFFSSKKGSALRKKIDAMQSEIKGISRADAKKGYVIMPARIEDYQGKTWATRKKPFVDRMASAWLIKKFIDKEASFKFIDEQDIESLDKNTVAFDIRGGKFTHVGDMCTFEVLIKSFGLKTKALQKIAEIVHEIDVKDGKFKNLEADGIEEVLIGIRKTAKDNSEALEKGITIFEMLYASKI